MSEYRQQRCPHGWVDNSKCAECKKDVKIAQLEAENAELKRGEFICKQCGLRKDSEPTGKGDF